MERVQLSMGRSTLSIETGRMAKQADGAVLVRLGDTVVLATACAPEGAAAGRRLPAADRRLPREHLRGRQDPRRLLQARGPAEREGSPDLAHDRPPAAAAVPRGLRAARPRSSACCSPPTWRTTPTPWPSPAPRRRSTSPTSRSTARSARCAWASGTAQCVVNPTTAELRGKSQLNLLVAGTEDAIVMVESGAQELSEAEMVRGAQRRATRSSSRSSACRSELRAAGGQAQARRSPRRRSTRAASAEVEAALAQPLPRGHAHARASSSRTRA